MAESKQGFVTLSKTEDGVNIWLQTIDRPNSPMVSIASINGQTQIRMINNKMTGRPSNYQIVLCIDEQTGEPHIQVKDDKQTIHLTADNLFTLGQHVPGATNEPE